MTRTTFARVSRHAMAGAGFGRVVRGRAMRTSGLVGVG
jgi:hypothetical protein